MLHSTNIVAICIATYMRPLLLKNCLHSLTKIIVPEKYTPIIIVVDNDILRSGESEFNTIKTHFNFKSYYYVESKRGVSSVRNCLLEKATLQNANLIAFIDDDELAHKNWLINILKGFEKYQCNIIAGPVIPTSQTTAPNSFKKDSKKPKGSVPRNIPAGNVLFTDDLFIKNKLRFDNYFNFIGCEDFDFFDRAIKNGMTSVWIDDAIVFETITPERKKLGYVLYRHLTGGINVVMRYRRHHSLISAWLRYVPKILSKFVSAIFSFLIGVIFIKKNNFKKAIIRIANGIGYLFGLTNIIIERYKY